MPCQLADVMDTSRERKMLALFLVLLSMPRGWLVSLENEGCQWRRWLYSFNTTHAQDPSLDPSYADYLKSKCPPPSSSGDDGSQQPDVDLDFSTPHHLDNSYYIELTNHRGLLISDQTLLSSSLTSKMVLRYAHHGSKWETKFAKAM
uniref:peroxidase n=1 Tax=Cucumis melo TaxID=3656 RepID=A0A9I9CCQ2_CUCME